MPGGIEVTGLDALIRDLDALGADIEGLQPAFAELASQGARLAAGFAPRRTGRLAGSIRGTGSAGKAEVTASAVYAGPINYGWARRNISGTGFMQAADAALHPEQKLEQAVQDAIRRAGL